jgi:hypothetical protein
MTTETTTLEALGARLDVLERQNRGLRRSSGLIILGACALAAFALLGPRRSAGTIEARRLVIRDHEGRVRGSFGVDSGGLPALKLLDRRGLEQVELGIPSEDSSALLLSDRGEPRVLMDTSIEGRSSIRIYDASRQLQAGVALDPDGSPHLTLGDARRPESTQATPGEAAAVSAGRSARVVPVPRSGADAPGT